MKTREKFLKASSQLFSSHGYSGTGLKQIVAESGAPWGSMYHFFPGGKEQLGAEAVAHAGARDDEGFRSMFARTGDPVAAIREIFKWEMKRIKKSDFADGCPVASVATDVAATSEQVRNACSDSFARWETTIAHAFLDKGVARAEAKAVASVILSMLEGATLLSRTHRSTKPFEHAAKALELTVKDVLSRAGRR